MHQEMQQVETVSSLVLQVSTAHTDSVLEFHVTQFVMSFVIQMLLVNSKDRENYCAY